MVVGGFHSQIVLEQTRQKSGCKNLSGKRYTDKQKGHRKHSFGWKKHLTGTHLH